MAARENLPQVIGNKISTTLVSSITDVALSLQVTDPTGMNTTGGYIVVDYGVDGKEEVMYSESRSSNTLAIATDGRGLAGTSAVAHDAGAAVQDILIDEHIQRLRSAFISEHDQSGAHTAINLALALSGNTINSSNKIIDANGGNTLSSVALSATNKIMDQKFDGWIPAGETWVYASADDPTFTFTIAGVDLTTKYTAGMKIKLTQTSAKYFIITKVAFSTDTTITVYGGTDYDLANAAITSPYFSREKAPTGFPMSPAKWSLTASGSGTQATPGNGTWYNLGASLAIPIGSWRVQSTFHNFRYRESTTGSASINATLSNANNTESDTSYTLNSQTRDAGGSSEQRFSGMGSITRTIDLTSKTTYYQNVMAPGGTASDITGQGTIEAVCAYL